MFVEYGGCVGVVVFDEVSDVILFVEVWYYD